MTTTSAFLYHTPCCTCGSSDALGNYEDGSTYCFSCQTYSSTNKKKVVKRDVAGALIPEGEYKPLQKRKIKLETVQKYGYTVGTHKGKTVHIAPYHNKQGVIVAQHIRYPDKDFSWTGESKDVQLFGQHLFSSGGKMLIITEGEIDCMSVSQIQGNKYPVVSIPSGASGAKKAIANNLEWVESFERVVFCFDSDDAGRKASIECASIITPSKARIVSLPLKDASEMLQADRIQELIRCIWDARVYRPDGIVSGKDLLDDLLRAPKKGFSTPYPKLNDTVQGIRKGELYLFSAGSGMGKSTLVNEIGYYFMMEHKLTIGVIALEENKKRTAERYAGIYLNKPLHIDREGVTEEHIKEAYHAVLSNDRFWLYDHFGSLSLDNLLSKIRYMAVGLNCDFIILDHISIVVSGLDEAETDERKMIDKLMTKLRSLVEETGVGILAIVHLKRPQQGKGFTEGRQVTLGDMRGSGALEQLSDVVIALERDQGNDELSNISDIRVLKNRPVGIVGVCDTLKYTHETGRLELDTPFGSLPETATVQPTKNKPITPTLATLTPNTTSKQQPKGATIADENNTDDGEEDF